MTKKNQQKSQRFQKKKETDYFIDFMNQFFFCNYFMHFQIFIVFFHLNSFFRCVFASVQYYVGCRWYSVVLYGIGVRSTQSKRCYHMLGTFGSIIQRCVKFAYTIWFKKKKINNNHSTINIMSGKLSNFIDVVN